MALQGSRLTPVQNSLFRLASAVAALTWAAVIYYLSDQPGIQVEPLFSHQDKVMHLVFYCILGIFCMGAMSRSGDGYQRMQIFSVSLLTGVYGLLDEFHQSFVPGRTASLGDVLADLAGGLLGALIVFKLAQRQTTV